MARLAQFTLDGYTGRMNPRTGIVEFGPPPAVRRRFAADGDLKAQIARLKAQVAESLDRAERAEAALARIQLAKAAVSPALTASDAFEILGAKIYAERRQMSAPERPTIDPEEIYRQRQPPAGGSSAALYVRRRTQVEADPEETAPEPPQASLGMAAEAVYAARRRAAQREGKGSPCRATRSRFGLADEIAHGEWLPWLKQQQESGAIGFSQQTASKYMKLAANYNHERNFPEAPSIRAALELLADKEPEEQQGELVGYRGPRLRGCGARRN